MNGVWEKNKKPPFLANIFPNFLNPHSKVSEKSNEGIQSKGVANKLTDGITRPILEVLLNFAWQTNYPVFII